MPAMIGVLFGKQRYCFSVSSNAKLPSANGCETTGLESIEFTGYVSVVVVGKPHTFPDRISIITRPSTCLLPSGARSICVPGSIKNGYGFESARAASGRT